jgi:type I site-specific restriction-modification system R (restriction) subunit
MSKKDNFFNYEFSGTGLSTSEKRWGNKRFNDYVSMYPHLRKLSDLQLLNELVFMEAIQERYKVRISKLVKKAEKNNADAEIVPEHLQRQLKTNLDQIRDLKKDLGLFEEKNKLDAYKDLQDLFEKFAVWRKENQGSRKVTCPFCSKIFFLMIRTDKFEAKKFPFFKDKVLCNPTLHKLWKEERISTEEYAQIMGTSSDYPSWLDENWFRKDPLMKDEEDKPSGTV